MPLSLLTTATFLLAATQCFATTSDISRRKLFHIEDPALNCIETDFQMNFFESTVVTNELHLEGELRYQGIGSMTSLGVETELDLVVTVQPGQHYYSSAAEGQNGAVNANGKNGQFGNINVRNVEGCVTNPNGFGCNNTNPILKAHENGEGIFLFTIVESGTNNQVQLDFTFFFFDIDNRNANSGIKERLVVKGWDNLIYPNTTTRDYTEHIYGGLDENGNIVVYPDDNETDEDNRASFVATTSAGNRDNPADPNHLTVVQQRKSIGFKFTDTSQFAVEFYEQCSLDDPAQCGVTGGNVLFAGSADDLAVTCVAPAITSPPTVAGATSPPTVDNGGPNISNGSQPPVDNGGFNGDPIIIGLQGQVFKFDGRDNAWYANVVSKAFQWNMQFKQYPTCEAGSDVFVSGMSIITSSESNDSNIMILTTPEAIEGCDGDHCLGEGTLHISLDNGNTFVSRPGDYHASGNRVVAHNTYSACSRRWHDYDISPNTSTLRSGGRRMSAEKTPLDLLSEKKETMINPEECSTWIEDRVMKGDLFEQKGHWATLDIETPSATFHVEYRQSNNDKADRPCDFQSLDAWMVTVSKDLETEKWQGILGETKQKVYDNNGNEVTTDRSQLLRGAEDVDYEVDGPLGIDFNAKNKMTTSWF